jgi:hypothetical protein
MQTTVANQVAVLPAGQIVHRPLAGIADRLKLALKFIDAGMGDLNPAAVDPD